MQALYFSLYIPGMDFHSGVQRVSVGHRQCGAPEWNVHDAASARNWLVEPDLKGEFRCHH